MFVWRQRDLKREHEQFLGFPSSFRFRSDPDNYSIDASEIEHLGYIKHRFFRFGVEVGASSLE